MKRVIIVQARMTSSRLPGKVLMDLAGRPMLSQQFRRLRACRKVDEVMVATTTNASDDGIVAWARQEGVRCFRGSEENVLSRYLGAAREAKAELIVRITADCPLIDPEETDRVIEALETNQGGSDYAANNLERTFPRGLDTEAFFMDALERVGRLASSASALEHVTFAIYAEHPQLFLIRSIKDRDNNSDLRWTVDTRDDFAMVQTLYDQLDLAADILPYRQILSHVRAHPDIAAINSFVKQKDPTLTTPL